jgi:hypothetical protein
LNESRFRVLRVFRGVQSGPGVLTGAALLLVFLGLAVSIDYPRTALGFKGDEATYYMLAHSIARDGDFTYQRHDLTRVWEDFPSGPEGVFLKKGRDVQGMRFIPRPPFFQLVTEPDPAERRLYYAKSFAYPLFAAPFVAVFGTNGFLVFHAVLLALCFAAGYTFLSIRGTPRGLAAAFTVIFLFVSAVPIYYVSVAPEFFNFAVVLLAYFLWTYRRTVDPGATELPGAMRLRRLLMSPAADLVAAVLLGIVTFSKPTNIFLILPLLAVTLLRREWRTFLVAGALFAATTAAFFAWNAAITGEFNYQGGDRKSFYSSTSFPFANSWETFENRGAQAATDAVPVDVLVHSNTFQVFAWNAMYFVFGRYSGLLPYAFPALVAVVLFLLRGRERLPWQWLVLGGVVAGAVALVLYMPYTYSGGGGPIGNRYYLPYYAAFLFLLPPIRSVRPLLVALGVGALFTAKLIVNPFYAAFNPAEPAKAGPLRMLPIELTLLNDLPVSGDRDRARQQLAGDPPMMGYFADEGAYPPEGEFFWVRGGRRADVILRAPAPASEGGAATPLRIAKLSVQISNGAVPNRIRVSDGLGWQTVDLAPREDRVLEVTPRGGVPFKPSIYPTNYVYSVSISTSAGSSPFLDAPGESSDSRFLGAMVRLVPHYEGR